MRQPRRQSLTIQQQAIVSCGLSSQAHPAPLTESKMYYVTAWNPGNGAAFEATVADYFQATNLFNCACRCYRRVVWVHAETHEIVSEYDNT